MNLIKICTTTKKFSSLDEIVPVWVPIPPNKPQPTTFFYAPPPPLQTMKNLSISPRQTKLPDNSYVLHMFNNNTFTDLRTAYKYVLIPSYVIQVI